MPVQPRPYMAVKFEIDVSTRYHDYRRAWLGWLVTLVRLVSLAGSIVALLALSNWVESRQAAVAIIAAAAAAIGVVNLLDLVFHFEQALGLHTTLYQRFKALQAQMARHRLDWESVGPELDADAQEIRVDEPPTYYALYARAWNQMLDKYEETQHRRPLTRWQSLLQNLKRFRPDQFKPA